VRRRSQGPTWGLCRHHAAAGARGRRAALEAIAGCRWLHLVRHKLAAQLRWDGVLIPGVLSQQGHRCGAAAGPTPGVACMYCMGGRQRPMWHAIAVILKHMPLLLLLLLLVVGVVLVAGEGHCAAGAQARGQRQPPRHRWPAGTRAPIPVPAADASANVGRLVGQRQRH
jgi:hypothetical protein